jgi:opacity protein-like surface antigen
MNTLRRMLVAMLAATALLSAAVFAADANIAGEWDMAVETQAGTGTPHFSFKQDGSTLSGTYKGQLGEAPITGTVKGNEATWSFKVSAQGMDLTVTYNATIDGNTMKGNMHLGDMAEGTFTGKKSG